MVIKNYYPMDIDKINTEYNNDNNKIINLIHNSFCKYIIKKGKFKGRICFKKCKNYDMNKIINYCSIHDFEKTKINKKKYKLCNICNKKTFLIICKNCKKIINTPLPLVNQEEEELLNDSYLNKKLIIYPKALYNIKYKNNTININYIKNNLLNYRYNYRYKKQYEHKSNICLYNNKFDKYLKSYVKHSKIRKIFITKVKTIIILNKITKTSIQNNNNKYTKKRSDMIITYKPRLEEKNIHLELYFKLYKIINIPNNMEKKIKNTINKFYYELKKFDKYLINEEMNNNKYIFDLY